MASIQKRLRDIVAAVKKTVKRNPRIVGGVAVGAGAGVVGLTVMDRINNAFTTEVGDKTINFFPIIAIILLLVIGFVIFKKLK